MRSSTGPPCGIAGAMMLLACIPSVSGQTAPPFRSNPQLRPGDANPNAAETSPSGAASRELFTGVPAWGAASQGRHTFPRTRQPLPGIANSIPRPDASLLLIAPAPTGAPARPTETPIALQRRPGRNLTPQGGGTAFTFRTASAAKVLAQLGVGMQVDTWHTDNVGYTRRSRATSDVIIESRPILHLQVGSRLKGDANRTDYFLDLRYTPTLQTLLSAGTSTWMHRLAGEIGRASPALTTSVRFEYDENIFGARGDSTVEESSTVTEVSPLIEYSLSAKTVLRAEATWRRLGSQDSGTDRSEYILETAIATAFTPKTTLGVGVEVAHIPFDNPLFGSQNYQQIFASTAWQASPKFRVQARVGIERREFDKPVPKPSRVSPVASMILNWTPNDRASLNAGFLVRNQPSVSESGATFQELRLGVDGRQQIGPNFYLRGEAAILQRDYDSGTVELETVIRPALGFHTEMSRLLDSLNVEIYYQFRRVDSNRPGSDRDRNMLGIESTFHF